MLRPTLTHGGVSSVLPSAAFSTRFLDGAPVELKQACPFTDERSGDARRRRRALRAPGCLRAPGPTVRVCTRPVRALAALALLRVVPPVAGALLLASGRASAASAQVTDHAPATVQSPMGRFLAQQVEARRGRPARGAPPAPPGL